MDVTRPRTPGYIRTAWTAGSTPGRDPTRAAPPTQAAQGRRWSTRSRMRRWPWRALPSPRLRRRRERLAGWLRGRMGCRCAPWCLSARERHRAVLRRSRREPACRPTTRTAQTVGPRSVLCVCTSCRMASTASGASNSPARPALPPGPARGPRRGERQHDQGVHQEVEPGR
jgi:hypothetical protein